MAETNSSSGTSDKYPAASNAQHSYPEVATQMNQPPLNTYETPKSAYPQSTFSQQPQYQYQYPNQNGYVPPEAVSAPGPSGKRNPWGLSPLTVGLLVATITAIVVGAAVGGGVGGALSGKDSDSGADSSVPTATVTVTAGDSAATATATGTGTSTALPSPSSLQNYVVDEPYFVESLKLPDCTIDSETITSKDYSNLFNLYCGIDMANSRPDDDNPDLVVADFVGLFAYTVTDCLYACSNAIMFSTTWGHDTTQTCKGITWQASMSSSNTSDSANCWLKNGTSTQQSNQCNTCVSAKLVG